MPTLVVPLHLSRDDLLAVYQGAARQVVATSVDGVRVQFPASILRPYVDHDGVRGLFVLEFDARNRFQSIRRQR